MALVQFQTFPRLTRGADYANPAYAAAARAAGVKIVYRYARNLTTQEAQDCFAHGQGIIAILERGSQEPLQGHDMGVLRGQECVDQLNAVGYPKGGIVLVACDTNPPDLTACEAYMRAALGVIAWNGFTPGFYGGSRMWWRIRDVVKIKCRAAAASWSPASIVWSPEIRQGVQEPSHRWDWDWNQVPIDAWLPHDVPDPLPPVNFPAGQFGLWPLATNKKILKLGSTGSEVDYLQWVIQLKAGGDCPNTHRMDAHTVKRVKDCQRLFGIVQDGVVGWDRQPNGSVGPHATWPVIDMLAGR